MNASGNPATRADGRRAFLIAGGVTLISGGLGALAAMAWLPRSTRQQPQSQRASAVETTRASSTTSQSDLDAQAAPLEADTTQGDLPSQPEPTSSTTGPALSLTVLCRESWGAAEPAGELSFHTIDRLTVHHTAVVFDEPTEGPRRVRSFQAGHQRDGFVDIAYHYVIDSHGNIYEARSTDIPGETYTSYDPVGHFLVVCDGNFEEQSIPAPQLGSLAVVLAWASVTFGVPPETLGGHSDYAATACPGSGLADRLADGSLRSEVERLIAAGPIEIIRLCGEEGDERVRAISEGRV